MNLNNKERRELFNTFNNKKLKALLLSSLKEDAERYYYYRRGIEDPIREYSSPEYNIDGYKIRFYNCDNSGFYASVNGHSSNNIFSILDIFSKDYWTYKSLCNEMYDVARYVE